MADFRFETGGEVVIEDGRRGEFEEWFIECEGRYSMYTLLKDPQSGHSSANVSKSKKYRDFWSEISAVLNRPINQELDSHLRNRTYLPTSLTSRNGRTRRPDRERWLISRNHSCGVHEPVPIRRREICSRNELRRELGVILNVVERLQESLTNDTPSLQPYYIMLVEALS